VSPTVQTKLSLQGVPSGRKVSGGQKGSAPVHASAGSQVEVDGRHKVPGGSKASGHAALVPVHVSARSHTPTKAPQRAPAGRKLQLASQQPLGVMPGSQSSPGSSTPFPQV
jgi:hypothetical protein